MAKWSDMTKAERSEEMRRRQRVGAANRKHHKRQANSRVRHGKDSTKDVHVSYLYGKVETIIEYYANSNGIPVSTLTAGVASLLRHQESR